MRLKDLIQELEQADPNHYAPLGITSPHSYRGYYNELAFEPIEGVTVAAMLADARSAVGATYTGWKGGEYTMSENTPVHIAVEGSTGTELGRHLVAYMTGKYST